jgi:hypothetical protein
LVYTRHSNYGFAKYLHEVAERTFDGKKTYCADWAGLEPINLMKAFYRHYKKKNLSPLLPPEDFDQIIKRCPYLMFLPRDQAERIVVSMSHSISEAIDMAKPDYLFSSSVDNYVTDLLHRLCRKYGAKTVMLINSPIDMRTRITIYGEFNKVRDPDEGEIEAALDWILDDRNRCLYFLDFYKYTWNRHLKEYSLRFMKDLAFQGLKILYRDPLNYRFSVGTSRHGYGKFSFMNYRFKKYYDENWQDMIRQSKRPTIFVPLPQTPEATTTYWLKDLAYADFDPFILKAFATLSRDFDLAVKDHWCMPGIRDWRFYRRLKEIPNLVLIPAETNSRDVYPLVDGVMVGSGTSGIEAALRGKVVINLSEPYYNVKGHFLVLERADDIMNVAAKWKEFTPPPNTREKQRKIMRRVLEGTFKGVLIVNNRFNDEENWVVVCDGLKEYLSTYGSDQ